jgi:hypothetical protein
MEIARKIGDQIPGNVRGAKAVKKVRIKLVISTQILVEIQGDDLTTFFGDVTISSYSTDQNDIKRSQLLES